MNLSIYFILCHHQIKKFPDTHFLLLYYLFKLKILTLNHQPPRGGSGGNKKNEKLGKGK